MVRALELPTRRRQLVLLALLAVLVEVRPEGLVVAGSVVVAVILDGHLRGSLSQTLMRHAMTFVALALILVAALVAVALGLPVSTGGFHGVLGSLVHPFRVGKWAAWNLADYELSLGVIAVAAFPLGLGRLLRRDASESERSVGVAVLTLAAGILFSVVVLSASPYGLGILHERYLFYVTPLVLVCLARWLADGLPRPKRAAVLVGVAAVGLVATLPTQIALRSNNVDAPTMSFQRD